MLDSPETPALLLDLDKVSANIARMRTALAPHGVALRPHLKTCKNVEIARLMTEGWSGAVTVSTLREAEQFFAAGFNDILYAVGIAPNKLEHAAALRGAGADLSVIVDSVEAARLSARHNLPALIEIDSDRHRAGVAPDNDALLREIGRALGPCLKGVMTHGGGSYDTPGADAIAAHAELERAGAVRAAERLRAAGLPCPIVSVGSTPTALFGRSFAGVTEVRVGVYVFMDLVMAGLGVCAVEDIALSVLASVIGHQRDKNWLIVDAGWMAMSRDRGTQGQAVDQGYGLVRGKDGEDAGDLIMVKANQEHGIVARRDGGPIDFDRFPIGALLTILPNHACATAAQFDRYHVSNGAIWPRFGGWCSAPRGSRTPPQQTGGDPSMNKMMLGAASVLVLALTTAAAQPSGKALEAKLDASVSSADQMSWLKTMAAGPNHVGAPHNRANAEFLLAKFKEFGWDAKIETFQVLYPTPISTVVEMVSPERVALGGQESAVPGDASSQNLAGALPPYVAFQGDGDVTAPLVYVNYGMPSDYDDLARRGIDVKGKIVIARYGGGWRGLKPKLAQDHGAIGTIIYSDPANDGYGIAEPYPKGGSRPPQGVQRGAVMELPTRPGDPTTPGVGSVDGVQRLSRGQAETILKIPTLPMSYGDAQKLLAQLEGPVAPSNWRGALPITYRMGGTDKVKVHLAVKSDWSLKPVHNVIAKLPGKELPDEWVVRGNHHDGWVFGASDPLSGDVAMLSEAKALGAMYKAGWRPKRTIVYGSWDGEEPGLLGSTEWAEHHRDELKRKAVIYINTDGNGRGTLGADGTQSFQRLVNQVAADVKDPQTGVSALERARASLLADGYDRGGGDRADFKAAEAGADLPLGPLGSGSDYTAFLHHLGIPALNIGYGGEDESGGVYHSIYDSFEHFTRFDDPGLKYGAALSKTVGRLVLRIADADTPPQRFGDFASAVDRYLGEVRKLAETRREKDKLYARIVKDDGFRLASDPLKPVAAPAAPAPTPFVELAALDNAVDTLKTAAAAYDSAYAAKGAALAPAARARLNATLRDIDQLLLVERGLPFRPWYKYLAYAPGRFTGYGAKTLPGVREAIEERRFDDAATFANLTAAGLEAYAKRLDAARAIVDGK